MTLKVFCDHNQVAEYPDTAHKFVVVRDLDSLGIDGLTAPTGSHPEDLLIVKVSYGGGEIVAVHKHGEWHGAGHGIVCAYRDPDPNCQACNPLPEDGASSPQA